MKLKHTAKIIIEADLSVSKEEIAAEAAKLERKLSVPVYFVLNGETFRARTVIEPEPAFSFNPSDVYVPEERTSSLVGRHAGLCSGLINKDYGGETVCGKCGKTLQKDEIVLVEKFH